MEKKTLPQVVFANERAPDVAAACEGLACAGGDLNEDTKVHCGEVVLENKRILQDR